MPFLENALELILHEPKSTHFKLTCILVSFDFTPKKAGAFGAPPPPSHKRVDSLLFQPGNPDLSGDFPRKVDSHKLVF